MDWEVTQKHSKTLALKVKMFFLVKDFIVYHICFSEGILSCLPPLKFSYKLRFTVVAWGPSAPVSLPLCPLQLPVHCAELDAGVVLTIMDRVMFEGSDVLIGLAFDAATAHQPLRRLLFGVPTADDLKLAREKAPLFFNQLRFHDLPEHPLPRCPAKLAMFRCAPCLSQQSAILC